MAITNGGQMKKKTLGDVFLSIIEEGNIDRSVLCKGLCSSAALSRYIYGESRPDRLLLSVLLQRLGRSPSKFATLLNRDEYIYFQWKQRVNLAQIHKDWQQIEILLQEKEALMPAGNEVLQRQFYFLMQGIVQEKVYGNREKSLALMKQGICLTVPEFPNVLGKEVLLGMQEIGAMLLWQRLQSAEEVSFMLLKFLFEYVDKHYEDLQERVKIYPQVAGAYLELLFLNKKYAKCLSISEQAMQMMIETGYASYMEKILSIHVETAEKMGLGGSVHKKKVQLAAWKELMQDLSKNTKTLDDEIYMLDVWQEVELIDEVIAVTRRERGYSQESLSEDICAPETMSRIETGKRAPSRKNYEAIARKLELREDFFYGDIETSDFEVLETEWELTQLIMQRRWHEAEEKLQNLRERLDLSDKYNQLYVETEQCSIDKELGRISAKEQSVKLIEILGTTVQIPNQEMNIMKWGEGVWLHHFTREEMSNLILLADSLIEQQQEKQALLLLEKMLGVYRKSSVNEEFHYKTVILILVRISILKNIQGNYKESIDCIDEGIRISLSARTYIEIPTLVNNKADALEHLGQKETSLHYYKLAYYCAELMETHTAPVSKRSYEKLMGASVDWY